MTKADEIGPDLDEHEFKNQGVSLFINKAGLSFFCKFFDPNVLLYSVRLRAHGFESRLAGDALKLDADHIN